MSISPTILLVMIWSLFLLTCCEVQNDLNDQLIKNNEKSSSAKLPACASCRTLVESFGRGLRRTSRGKLGGGDAAWEERKQQKGYSRSEVRFVEIQEDLCKDVQRGEMQCHDNHHAWEEHLEQWWHQEALQQSVDNEHTEMDLFNYLCINTLKVCCPKDTFGPNCNNCPVRNDKGEICSGNGKCKGSGTRKGNGLCACDAGYAGLKCDACAAGHYDALQEPSSPLLCSPCHKSCLSTCSGPGPKSCLTGCKSGYVLHESEGCVDVDECRDETVCDADKEFCVNTDGHFRCLKCDAACKGCEGDGPDSCLQCSEGHVKSGEVCVDQKMGNKVFTLSNTRYFTYVGLCVATAIIFQRSVATAGVLGVVIAAYISFSEYYLATSTNNGDLRPVF